MTMRVMVVLKVMEKKITKKWNKAGNKNNRKLIIRVLLISNY